MVSMEKPKKITIDVLAGMINRSFEHIDKRFDGIDARLDRIEQKVDLAQENRLSHMEEDVRKIKTKLDL